MTETYPPPSTIIGSDILDIEPPSLLMILGSLPGDTESPYHMTIASGQHESGGIWIPVVRDICIAFTRVNFAVNFTGDVTLRIVYKTGAEGDETTLAYTPTLDRTFTGTSPRLLEFQTAITLRRGQLIRLDVLTSVNVSMMKHANVYGIVIRSPSNTDEGVAQMHSFTTQNNVSLTSCLFDSGTRHILIPKREILIENVSAVIGVGNTGFTNTGWSIALTFQAYTIADDHSLTESGDSREITFSRSSRVANDPDILEHQPLNLSIDGRSEQHYLRVSYVKTGITAASNFMIFSFCYLTQNRNSLEIVKENLDLNEFPHTILPSSIGFLHTPVEDGLHRNTGMSISFPRTPFQVPRVHLFTDATLSADYQINFRFFGAFFYGNRTDTRDNPLYEGTVGEDIAAPANGELLSLIHISEPTRPY